MARGGFDLVFCDLRTHDGSVVDDVATTWTTLKSLKLHDRLLVNALCWSKPSPGGLGFVPPD